MDILRSRNPKRDSDIYPRKAINRAAQKFNEADGDKPQGATIVVFSITEAGPTLGLSYVRRDGITASACFPLGPI